VTESPRNLVQQLAPEMDSFFHWEIAATTFMSCEHPHRTRHQSHTVMSMERVFGGRGITLAKTTQDSPSVLDITNYTISPY